MYNFTLWHQMELLDLNSSELTDKLCNISDNYTLPNPEYPVSNSQVLNYTLLYRIISVILNILIFVVGFIGNCLVVLVVVRTRRMRTPTNCYLMSLAIADCLVLLSATLPAIPETFFQIDEWPFGRVMCSCLVFLQYLGVDCSSLSITAFTVERYIAICHPLKSQAMCTVKRAKRIIAGIWIFGILYCSPWLGLTVLKTKKRMHTQVQICSIRLERSQYLTYYMTDLIVFYIIPLFIAAILYMLIARILFRNSISKENSTHLAGRSSKKRQDLSRMQVIRMLAVVVLVFMLTWMPYRTLVVYNSLAENIYMDLWFLLFCRTMVYMNSAINPILYNAMSVKFRRAFKGILCGSRTNDGSTSVYSEYNMENAMILGRRPTLEGKLHSGRHHRKSHCPNQDIQTEVVRHTNGRPGHVTVCEKGTNNRKTWKELV